MSAFLQRCCTSIYATWSGIRAKVPVLDRVGGAVLKILPSRVSIRLAPLLACIRPLEWYPGWTFAAGDAPGSLLFRMRLGLWNHCAVQRLETPFKVTWYESLSVLTYLGNDLSRCLYVSGTYEPNEFMFLKEVLRPGMTFIDVGANDGLYTLFASKCVAPGGRVVALEPSSREFRRLGDNLRINRLTNVIPLQMAASDHQGYGTLKLADFGHEGQNTLGEFAYDIQRKGTERVLLRKLDDLVREHALERIDVLKIDAEGSELAVLRGGLETLKAHKPIVLFELLEAALRTQGASRHDVTVLLQSLGYQFLVFGASGHPESVAQVNVDGVNVIAVNGNRDGGSLR